MSEHLSQRRRDVIALEAANYLIELESPQAQTMAALAAWLKTSPEHVEEFLAVASLWDALPGVHRQPSAEKLIEFVEDELNVVAIGSVSSGIQGIEAVESAAADSARAARSIGLRGWRLGLAATVMLAAALIGAAHFLRPPPADPNLFVTAVGEQTSLPLPDGSLVNLNTQSILRVEYSTAFRDIRLSKGEALFDVAPDSERPFRVITEHAVVTAVGTQFNVRNDTDDMVVTVVEGIVDVSVAPPSSGRAPRARSLFRHPPVDPSPTRLTVGQQARLTAQTGELAVVDAVIENATAWRERRLVFEALALEDVIDEFNRYNDPPLAIDDPQLRTLPISGVFRANDRASFVDFLKQMKLARSRTRADGTIVLHGIEEHGLKNR